MTHIQCAKFAIGQVVRHRDDAFQGVVLDVDPAYAGPEGQTGEVSPRQPFYSVLVTEEGRGFVAYAAEDALERDARSLTRAEAQRWFTVDADGHHAPRDAPLH